MAALSGGFCQCGHLSGFVNWVTAFAANGTVLAERVFLNINNHATQAFAAQLGIPHPNEYDSVHGNFYPDEGAGVAAHADDEPQLIPGAPIFSYTFLKGDDNTRAREFVIKRKAHPTGGVENIDATTGGIKVRLESGDLLVMAGDMQADFTHELPKLAGQPEGLYAPRLNFTVRRFVPALPSRDRV